MLRVFCLLMYRALCTRLTSANEGLIINVYCGYPSGSLVRPEPIKKLIGSEVTVQLSEDGRVKKT